MASFMSMQYDSDSDSVDDLDFEPASNGSSASDGDSADEDMDETMEDVQGEIDAAGSIVVDTPPPTSSATATKGASKKKASLRAQQQTATSTSASTTTPPAGTTAVSSSSSSAAAQVPQQPQPASGSATESAPTPVSTIAVGSVLTGDSGEPAAGEPLPVASGSSDPTAVAAAGGAPGEVVKKKKGPKKGTKYKKRATAVPDAGATSGKAPKTPKMTKKAAAAAAAAAAFSSQNMAHVPAVGRFAFQNTQVDLDHPLESFKWPYSPFTAEFKTQHRARDTMARDLHQAVQQITDTNNRSTWHLQELDQQLQMSRQDLKTSLDEIQFRKSQLRDMSLMAVDIVRKLSSTSSSSRKGRVVGAGGLGAAGSSSSSSSSVLPGGGTESAGRVSDLESDAMEVDGPEEVSGKSAAELKQSRVNELNEGNVRSFLEKIRELEQMQRHVMV
ncbi:MAG: hypothetical protein J3R72DRAFT_452391 [Linnemannia gamsii]|nr:MAG: hypothetical protein J3R72DRAFT_452391 [Linnemannia gamsii]